MFKGDPLYNNTTELHGIFAIWKYFIISILWGINNIMASDIFGSSFLKFKLDTSCLQTRCVYIYIMKSHF